MIHFYSETDFDGYDSVIISQWIEKSIENEGKKLGELSFIFMSDEQLLEVNKQYLNHDYYTDVISFEDNRGAFIGGDIFLSIDRITDNANEFSLDFNLEFYRVMIHGVLHFLGYKDKSEEDVQQMRAKEDYYLSLLPSNKG